MSTWEQLCSRLTRLITEAGPFGGTVYRSSTPKFATEADLLSGEGSSRHGGRWNPARLAAVYAALSPETAMAETLAHNRYYGIAIEDAMPRTFVAISVELHAVLDLRDGAIRRRLQVSLDRVLNVDWRREVAAGGEPLTHNLGRAACAVGLEGLIVPSAADETGHNLVIFPQNLRAGSQLRLRNAADLAE